MKLQREMKLEVSHISGDLPPEERTSRFAAFENNVTKVMIATNTLSRGINIPTVKLVVNYDIPEKYNERGQRTDTPDNEIFVHRVGRTARAGDVGIALHFCENPRAEQFLKEIARINDIKCWQLEWKTQKDAEKIGKKIRKSLAYKEKEQREIMGAQQAGGAVPVVSGASISQSATATQEQAAIEAFAPSQGIPPLIATATASSTRDDSSFPSVSTAADWSSSFATNAFDSSTATSGSNDFKSSKSGGDSSLATEALEFGSIASGPGDFLSSSSGDSSLATSSFDFGPVTSLGSNDFSGSWGDLV